MVSLTGSWDFDHIAIAAAFSPDVTRVAVTSRGRVLIYDIYTGQRLIDELGGHDFIEVMSVAFSPDGRTVAAGYDDTRIRLWDLETGKKVVEPLWGHSLTVGCLAFSLDGRFLVSGSEDGALCIWNARTGEMIREPVRPALWPWSLCFIPGNRLAIGWADEWTLTVYDMMSVTPLYKCIGHNRGVHSVSISPDGRLLASGSDDYTIRFWNPASGTPIGEPLKGHVGPVKSIRFSPDSRYIASGSTDCSIRIWDTVTRAPYGEPLHGHRDTVLDVAFTSDGKRLVSTSSEGAIKIWDVHSLQIGTETALIHETEPSPEQAILLTGAQESADMTDDLGILLDPEAEITSATTLEEIVSILSLRGCADMTYRLDLATCSEIAISSGGFGDIFRARLSDGTQVAIKTIRLRTGPQDQKILKVSRPTPSSPSQVLTRAQHAAREIYAWSKCKHPNVQPLLGLAMFRGRIGMIARWESNGNLSHYLEQRADVDRCALGNVLISQDGVAQLADFGNAKLQEYSLKFTETSTKEALSSRWAAPELFEGNRCSYATDVYALGMTILETITGDLPWTDKSERAIMFAITIKKACPERPEEYMPTNSAHGDTLWNLLRSCWEFEPEDRPISANVAQAVSEDLRYQEETAKLTIL
ncbi:hypothetical protein FRC09_014975 [Ceratobasidium sp. 395]|nr:hypothetical protein FRC09_014975 [Ceratobasidium sp. 395]